MIKLTIGRIWFIDPVGVVRYLHLANDNPVFGVGLISFCKLSRPGIHDPVTADWDKIISY